MQTACSQENLPPTLGGITLLEPFDPVSEPLGLPLQVVMNDFAAFGYEYIYSGLTLWAGLSVEGNVDIVWQIEATGSQYCTPSGVCPGMEAAEVQSILGNPALSDGVSEGRNQYLVNAEACWLEVNIDEQIVRSLAIRCQP
ncbi:MAG TPA: hypothetical protein VMR74_09820 [Gammaproteobacteria bacterium]|nr:hypothetical protein [Gammaproteobacteria bacterium]